MKKYFLHQSGLLFSLVGAVAFMLSGCGVPSGNHTALPQEISVSSITDDSLQKQTILPDQTQSLSPYEELVSQAGLYCSEGRFSEADSLYRIMLSYFDEGVSDSIFERFLPEIVTMYSTMMPDSIVVPDNIAVHVFQQQMMQSFDSLPYSAKDSSLVIKLRNRTNIPHDIPMVWNSRVEKSLFYYITKNKGTVEYWKKRSSRYLTFMKKMFADSLLPQDLAYLPLIESGFNPKAYSRSHASGIWQFIPSTGKKYGLRNNYWLDERRDPVRATGAAIAYLKKLYGDFGNWYLALAAYNCGEGGMARAINRCGTSDYWQLRLPGETMNYVPLFLAALTIAKDPDFTSGALVVQDTIPFDTVSVADCMDMREIATGIEVAYDTLKQLNPHIIHWCTPPDMTGVLLYLPSGKAQAFRDFYAALPPEKKVKWYRYRVLPGDNLGSIARHFKLPVQGLQAVNELKGSRIVAGHYLFIPIPAGGATPVELPEPDYETKQQQVAKKYGIPPQSTLVVYEVKTGDTVWKLAELFKVTTQQIFSWNKLRNSSISAGQILSIYTRTGASLPPNDKAAPHPSYVTTAYTVQQGDTPYGISRMYQMSTGEFCILNGLDELSPIIRPGDTLRVRKMGAGAPPQRSGAGKLIPPAGAIRYVVSSGDNLFGIARNFSVTVDAIKRCNNFDRRSLLHSGDTIYIPSGTKDVGQVMPSRREAVLYTVKNGDNLWRIASTFGVPVEQLYENNGLQAGSVLMPGDTIRFFIRKDL